MSKDKNLKLNLPKTDFPMRANLAKREPEILNFWRKIDIYKKILEKRKGGPYFVLHDGPPYSNAPIHLGHALNKILKDMIIKYKALCGFYTPFIPGWDNHGMPIENEILKRNKNLFENIKDEKVRYDIRQKCREFAKYWVEKQKEEFIRLGIFADWDNPYLTMDKNYEAKETEYFADIVEKGYIYRGYMPIHWCANCQTALAMAEIEYKEKVSPSIWFRMKRKSGEGYALVWTTTPWTIISNLALAFHPDFWYVWVEIEGEKYLLAEGLLNKTAEELGWEGKGVKILDRIKGKDIEGEIFKHPFFDRDSPAILADFVTLEEGTGIVHIAPGHGKEDFEVGRKYGLKVLSPVNERGIFTEEAGELFKGLNIEEASNKVIEILKEKKSLLKKGEIKHSYPHCWRCKKPLIFRATHQWFLDLSHNNLRNKALDWIFKVKWVPAESQNRIYASVAERPDWVMSRQRVWGVPIPAVRCKTCGYEILSPDIIRKTAEIFKEEGADAWDKYPVEKFIPQGFKCPKCGSSVFEKMKDVLDVWFDSGITSLIVLKDNEFPSDVYLEGSDQHRGWFNASLMVSIALKGEPPYKSVITHGWVLDEQGRAMHKSLGNVIMPSEIVNKYGAELLRLWVAQSDYTKDVRLGKEILQRLVEAYRKIRNTIRFMLANLHDFNPEKNLLSYNDLLDIDKYILWKFENLKREVKKHYDNYEFFKIYQKVYNFCISDLSSFWLDITKDRLYTWYYDSIGRRSAQSVIYMILKEFLIILSPILSFTTEEAWSYLPGKKEESVFLENYPSENENWFSFKFYKDYEIIYHLREKVNKLIEEMRNKNIISDRLEGKISLIPKNEELKQIIEKHKEELAEIFVVSQVDIGKHFSDGVSVSFEDIDLFGKHADGQKCQRCWMWHVDIKEGLCPKCRLNLSKYEDSLA